MEMSIASVRVCEREREGGGVDVEEYLIGSIIYID